MIGIFMHVPISNIFAEMNIEHLRELHRFAVLGRLSASLIHDMSSPLTAAILHLEQEEHNGPRSVKRARHSIRIMERYLEAARQQLRSESNEVSFDAKKELEQLKPMLIPLARRRGIRLRFASSAQSQLTGDPVQFQRIMTNLIINAMDAYDGHLPSARPVVRVTLTSTHQHLTIKVRDYGSGIPAEQLSHIFEPFYTTKPPRRTSGLGFGLASVKHYVEDGFGGSICVTSLPQNGTLFTVRLRRTGASQAS